MVLYRIGNVPYICLVCSVVNLLNEGGGGGILKMHNIVCESYHI